MVLDCCGQASLAQLLRCDLWQTERILLTVSHSYRWEPCLLHRSRSPRRSGNSLRAWLRRYETDAKTGEAVTSPEPLLTDSYLTPAFRISISPTTRFLVSSKSIKAEWAGLVKGSVGLYQLNIKLPDTLPDGTYQCPGENLNVRLALRKRGSSRGSGVAP